MRLSSFRPAAFSPMRSRLGQNNGLDSEPGEPSKGPTGVQVVTSTAIIVASVVGITLYAIWQIDRGASGWR